MVFSRFAYFVFAFCLLCLADTLQPVDTPAANADKEDWKKLDRPTLFPPCYTDRFVDSIKTFRQVAPAAGLRTLDSVPFGRGEKFVYEVGWGPFRAGFIILESDIDTATGRLVVVARGFTNNFFSALYRVRDYIRTTMDPKGLYPFFFEQHLREGRYKADRWEMFDQAGGKVYTHGNDTGSVSVPTFVQNFLSLVIYIRSLSYGPGDSFSVECFVHSKSFNIVAHCKERKPVEVEAGTFNCLLVKPVLVGEGRVFTKKDEIKLWLTNDGHKMPVMVKAKIAVGSIMARLIWYERKE